MQLGDSIPPGGDSCNVPAILALRINIVETTHPIRNPSAIVMLWLQELLVPWRIRDAGFGAIWFVDFCSYLIQKQMIFLSLSSKFFQQALALPVDWSSINEREASH